MLPATLHAWLEFLEARRPEHEPVPGTERMLQVLPALTGGRKIGRQVVAVAGTNGKGSTVAFLEAMLVAAGVSCGATTSPHLFHYNERIRINCRPVPEEEICRSFTRIEQLRRGVFISYFEFGALAAFDIFAQHSPDVVLLEVGLGGRLDAMNAVDADIGVITTVSLDHQKWLGDTVEVIAGEKAGIYRAGRPAIFGDVPLPASVRDIVSALPAVPYYRDEHFHATYQTSGCWTFSGQSASSEIKDLPPSHLPFTSAVCAVQAALLLQPSLPHSAIRAGLARANLPGRNQRVMLREPGTDRASGVTVHLDVAHNPQAAMALAGTLQNIPCTGRRIALIAVVADKDFAGILEALTGVTSRWIVTTIGYQLRALDGKLLYDWLAAREYDVCVEPDIPAALANALQQLEPGDELVVAGSFHTVAETVTLLEEKQRLSAHESGPAGL